MAIGWDVGTGDVVVAGRFVSIRVRVRRTVVGLDLIGVPFDGYGRAGNQAAAAAVLRAHGFDNVVASRGLRSVADVALPAPSSARGADTSVINEAALLAMTDAVGERVSASVGAGHTPVARHVALIGPAGRGADNDLGLAGLHRPQPPAAWQWRRPRQTINMGRAA